MVRRSDRFMGFGGKANRLFGVKQIVFLPWPASSEEERSLCKIVFSGNPSWNPASNKKDVLSFFQTIFALSETPIHQSMSPELEEAPPIPIYKYIFMYKL